MVFVRSHTALTEKVLGDTPPSKPARVIDDGAVNQSRCTPNTAALPGGIAGDDTVDGRSGINATADIHWWKRWMSHTGGWNTVAVTVQLIKAHCAATTTRRRRVAVSSRS